MHALVLSNVISEAERESLGAAAADLHAAGRLTPNRAGPHRFRLRLDGTDACGEPVLRVAARIRRLLGLGDAPVDRHLGWILSLIEPGGFVRPHLDRHQHYQDTDDRHLRCNVLVQGEDPSAYPIIDNRVIRVRERGVWAFFASEYLHGTQPLAGAVPRIVYQFGFAVPASFSLEAARANVARAAGGAA